MEKRDLGKLGKCEICENWDFCNLQKLGILQFNVYWEI